MTGHRDGSLHLLKGIFDPPNLVNNNEENLGLVGSKLFEHNECIKSILIINRKKVVSVCEGGKMVIWENKNFDKKFHRNLNLRVNEVFYLKKLDYMIVS